MKRASDTLVSDEKWIFFAIIYKEISSGNAPNVREANT